MRVEFTDTNPSSAVIAVPFTILILALVLGDQVKAVEGHQWQCR